jgi:hypothetical protein
VCAAPAGPRTGLEQFEERSSMAGLQPARDVVRAESIAEWMERRRREVAARGPEAELAGRAAWAAGGFSGELPHAPRPRDVVTLGTRTLQQGRGSVHGYPAVNPFAATPDRMRRPVSGAQTRARPVAYRPTSTATPHAQVAGAAQQPTREDPMAKLRREQAAFKEVVGEESRRNSWMAIPVLAPLAVPLLAEGAGLLAGRLAASQLRRAPLNILGREPGLAPKPPLARPGPAARPSPKPRADAEEKAIRRAARER